MIKIVLSELDFDYELQALVNSFFSGQRSSVEVGQELTASSMKEILSEKKEKLVIGICFRMEKITIGLYCNEYFVQKEVAISGNEDWHKHEDKSAHPYRTYYKNELKRLLFLMLCDLTEDILTDAGLERRIPAWGTMTGVRPTKIPMNQLLQGKEKQEVEEQMRKWYCCTNEKLQLGLQIAIKEAALLKDISFEGGYSLYIGIPFCPTTCLYCSFPSYPYERFGYLADAYVKALKKEITAVSKECKNRKLTSIYMGGGTPTTLTAKQLEEVLTHIRQCFPTDDQYEFTVEAGRPDSITREKLAVLRKYHVERISVNPQTMQQKTLDLIGRRHSIWQENWDFPISIWI